MSENEVNVLEEKLPGWQEMSPGGHVLTPGSSVGYRSSDWAAQKQIWNPDTCNHCLRCWSVCPDNCIDVEDGKMVALKHFYCKACGLCMAVCPTKPNSLTLVPQEIE